MRSDNAKWLRLENLIRSHRMRPDRPGLRNSVWHQPVACAVLR